MVMTACWNRRGWGAVKFWQAAHGKEHDRCENVDWHIVRLLPYCRAFACHRCRTGFVFCRWQEFCCFGCNTCSIQHGVVAAAAWFIVANKEQLCLCVCRQFRFQPAYLTQLSHQYFDLVPPGLTHHVSSNTAVRIQMFGLRIREMFTAKVRFHYGWLRNRGRGRDDT